MQIVNLSTKGQIVIPKKIRDALGVQSGARFGIELADGKIILKPVKEYAADDLFGKFKGLDLLGDLSENRAKELKKETVRER
ncbi:MAG: AbrB/MazE/SpoVT family DNA-binding domain-containing protein [Desulfotomaculales bacterium]